MIISGLLFIFNIAWWYYAGYGINLLAAGYIAYPLADEIWERITT